MKSLGQFYTTFANFPAAFIMGANMIFEIGVESYKFRSHVFIIPFLFRRNSSTFPGNKGEKISVKNFLKEIFEMYPNFLIKVHWPHENLKKVKLHRNSN